MIADAMANGQQYLRVIALKSDGKLYEYKDGVYVRCHWKR
jgi:hypothetical protein